MNEAIIHKYLSRETTIEEERALLEWINESPENKELFFEVKTFWRTSYNFPFGEQQQEEELNASLKSVNERINNLNKRQYPISRYLKIWSSVAAILALGILSYHFITKESKNHTNYLVFTNNVPDSVMTLTLADGTNIWLRTNTTITYPEVFTGGIRDLELDGEAFFEVQKDSLPFIIKTDAKLIKVLGTSFSVNTHSANNMVETVLMSGKVQIQRIGGESLTTLHPGQQALYSKDTKMLEINEVDANMLTSWRYGITSLSDVSINEIILCLENTYNIKIQINLDPLKDRRYNFSFKKSKGADEALKQLSFITGMSVQKLP